MKDFGFHILITVMYLAILLTLMIIPEGSVMAKILSALFLPLFLVLLSAVYSGPFFGMALAVFYPLLSALLFRRLPLFPESAVMILTLLSVSAFTGFFFRKSGQSFLSVFFGILVGAAVNGASSVILFYFAGRPFLLTDYAKNLLFSYGIGAVFSLIAAPLCVNLFPVKNS